MKKMMIICGLVVFVGSGIAAIQPTLQKKRNLQVLPADISDYLLDSIMQSYNKALGVSCNFCHIPAAIKLPGTQSPGNLDFSLDNGMKEQARRMMRLTIDLNKNYFYYDTTKRPEFLNVVSCNTCHRGHAFPYGE